MEYLNKETILEAEIFDVFTSHLGQHTGKVSLKSAISIEQGWSSLSCNDS
jgi:hypothetical protein